MRIPPLLFLLFLFSYLNVRSQTIDTSEFVPDRPGMATPPAILTKKSLQIEDGIQYEDYFNGLIHNKNYMFSSLLLRYGVLNNVEVRVQSDYVYNTEVANVTSTTKGLDPITLGSKIKLAEQRKLLPNISLLLNVTLPFTGKKEFRPDKFAPSVYILMSNDITEKINVCYNYGLSWDGSSSAPTHFYALCLGANLNRRWSAFMEGYGYSSQSANPDFYIDAGVAFLITHHLQLDCSASGYLNSFTKYYLLSAGIALKL
jgi:hypothetical protein